MRRWLDFARWSIAGRLLMLALAPAILMVVVVNAALYWQSLRDVAADINERGQLIARSLAESSRYGVVSGNTMTVDETVRSILATDPSVMRIEVLDAGGTQRVNRARRTVPKDIVVVEARISAEALQVDMFDATPTPRRPQQASPLGFVRVSMSPSPVVALRAQRVALSSVFVVFSAALSAALGLALARRLREPLARVMHAIRAVMAGKFDVLQESADAPGELGELQRAVKAMAQGLQLTHQRLESEVNARTAQLKEALERIQMADAERRRLIAWSNAAVEAERRRISVEIHDDLNAALVSVRMHAAVLTALARASGQPELADTAHRMATLIDQTYDRARNIVRNLRPEVLDALGLPGAAEEMARHFDEVGGHCRYSFELAGPVPALGEEVAITSYRILQEALSNVSKHAAASRCHIKLRMSEDHASVVLTVSDDGAGFEATETSSGLGLVGMRERLAALGGAMLIDSAPGRGTTLTVTIPHEDA